MPEILQLTMADLLRDLPEAVPFQQALLGGDSIDALFCCAGFEERSRAILSDICGVGIGAALVVVYPTNAQDNAETLEKIRCNASVRAVIEVAYQRQTFLRAIRQALGQFTRSDKLRLVVDLSGMASYIVYRVLSTVCELLPNAELGVYYAEAEQYSPSREEWSQFYESVSDPEDNLAMAERYEQIHFQSVGVDETYESDVFPGRNIDPLATDVIAIPSFSLERMKSMLAYAESRYTVPEGNVRWLLGQPPDRKKNGWRYDALAALYNVRNQGLAISTLNYREILQQLDELWDERHASSHMVIANMGSKMQHLGAFLFLQMHPGCGLLLCEPERFIASRYSTGVGAKWWLDFGQVSRMRELLRSRGGLRFIW